MNLTRSTAWPTALASVLSGTAVLLAVASMASAWWGYPAP